MIRKYGTAIVTLMSVALLPLLASAQVSPGTQLVGNIDQSLSSRDVQVGQPFTISNAHSLNYNISGATIYGHVASVQRAGQGTPGRIELDFDKVNTRSGNVYQITGYTTNMQAVTRSNAGSEAGATAAGALLGGLLTHNTAGWIIGGAGGLLYAKNSRQNVVIPQNSVVTVQIQESRRQAQHM